MKLHVEIRQVTGKKVAKFRKQGKIPAVIYGHNSESQNLWVDYLAFVKIHQREEEGNLIDLEIGGESSVKALVQEVQTDSVTNRIIHVDFRKIKMDEKVTTEIYLEYVGEPPAVKELGGSLVKNIDKVEVECLPQYLGHRVQVDLSGLNNFENVIRVRDLEVPEGMKFLTNPEEVVATVTAPREEEEEVLPEKTGGEATEKESGDKEEEGQPADGEAGKARTKKDSKD